MDLVQERLPRRRNEKHLLELQCYARFLCDRKVPIMNGVERAAEDADASRHKTDYSTSNRNNARPRITLGLALYSIPAVSAPSTLVPFPLEADSIPAMVAPADPPERDPACRVAAPQ